MRNTGLGLALIAALSSPAPARADVVLDWNAIAVSATGTGQGPFNQARLLAITQLAVFEAVNAIAREYEPYLGTVVAPAGASADAAAVTAAHRVLKNYLPGSAAMLDAALATSLAAMPDGSAKAGGIATGEAAAAAMIAARVNDGATPPMFYLPASTNPGAWQLTPSCPPGGGVFYHWRDVKTFGIAVAADFRAEAPPALTSHQYAKDYDEVRRVGRSDSTDRPADRANVVRFYAATSPGYVVNSAARQLASAKGHSLVRNARSLALLNMAVSDALVVSFDTKYHFDLWRPETAIRNADVDGNPETIADASWTPYIPSPCFPAYASNHASGSYSGSEILRRLYGAAGHKIAMSNPAVPGISFEYHTLKDICADVDDARIYGGIHFRFDQEGGARLGRIVATAVYLKHLTPVNGTDPD